jgi:hypothetical protein
MELVEVPVELDLEPPAAALAASTRLWNEVTLTAAIA